MWLPIPPGFELEPWIKYTGLIALIVMVVITIFIKERDP